MSIELTFGFIFYVYHRLYRDSFCHQPIYIQVLTGMLFMFSAISISMTDCNTENENENENVL